MIREQETTHKKASSETYKLKRLYLGDPYENIYFTPREASCIWEFLNHKTINETAKTLGLSPRTVEFYTNNMKAKLGCYSKAELVQRVMKSQFIRHYLLEKNALQ